MKYWYDTEFLEDGRTIELISIGIVAEDGREFYAVNGSMDQQRVLRHDWLRINVWPHLPIRNSFSSSKLNLDSSVLDVKHKVVQPKVQIAKYLEAFFSQDNEIELWAYYGAYDHVALAQIFGTMQDLPVGIPWYTNELMQLWKLVGKPEKPPEPLDVH